MGSNTSVVEVKQDKKGGFQVVSRDGKPIAAGGRKQGFKEVEIVYSDGAKASSSKQKTAGGSKGKSSKEYHDKASELMANSEDPFSSSTPNQQQNGEDGQPTYGEDDELVMETFYHSNGAVYTCVYQGGQRFYLDSWQTQDWQPFPRKWYKEGVLVTDRIMKNEEAAGAEGASVSNAFQQMSDDREGYIDHPEKGRLATYIFEEKRNIHYFFDQDSGNWIRLPISWELNSELIQKLIDPIQESLPEWQDRHDVLAALRAANYDPHDCIATFLAVSDKGHIAMPKNAEDVKMIQEKDAKIKDLEEKCKKLKKKLEKTNRTLEEEEKDKDAAESTVRELRERVSTLEADVSSASAQLNAAKRPKTAKSARGGSSDVSADTIQDLHRSAKALHIEYSQLKMETQKKFEELQYIMKQITVATMRLKMFDSDQTSELDELRELYRRETLQRKLLYNQLQEIKGNIRVFCRCRRDDSIPNCLEFPNDQEVRAPGSKRMKFDKVFTPIATQEEVFDEVKSIITSCVDGYNVCTLAYGQTGSGKTYTMMGPKHDPGVNVRAVMELLKICQERDNVDYTLKASMVEIYNETIQDLLSETVDTLDLRIQGKKLYLPGISEMFVETMDDVETIMRIGDKNRSTAATKMNSHSSRSHLIFMITVEGRDKASGATSQGTLTLCDLAGSERVAKTEAQGKRLIEAAAINKSLTSLGQVFTALRTGQLHIPYRNSKLTHLLQPSLGGDAKSILFVNVRTDEDNLCETISTLSFGDAARNVSSDTVKRRKKKRPHVSAAAAETADSPKPRAQAQPTQDGGWIEDF